MRIEVPIRVWGVESTTSINFELSQEKATALWARALGRPAPKPIENSLIGDLPVSWVLLIAVFIVMISPWLVSLLRPRRRLGYNPSSTSTLVNALLLILQTIWTLVVVVALGFITLFLAPIFIAHWRSLTARDVPSFWHRELAECGQVMMRSLLTF